MNKRQKILSTRGSYEEVVEDGSLVVEKEDRPYKKIQSFEVQEPDPQPEVKNDLRKLLHYARQQWHIIALGLITLLGGLVVEFAIPKGSTVFMQLAQESAKDPEKWDELKSLSLLMVVIVIISSICGGVRANLFNLASERIARNLREDVFYAVTRQEVAFFDQRKTGELLSRLNSDVTVIQESLSTNVALAVRSSIFIVVALLLLFVQSWKLAIFILGVFVPVGMIMGAFGLMMKKLQKAMQTQKANLSSQSEEAIGNIRTVKAFSTEAYERDRYSVLNEAVFGIGRRIGICRGLGIVIISLIMWGTVIAILLFGAFLVKNNEISSTDITYFVITLLQLIANFMIFGTVINDVMRMRGAASSLLKIVERTPAIKPEGGLRPNDAHGNVELDSISFCYPAKPDVEVLHNLSFTAKKGSVVALVGSSGGGKSSVVALLERLYDPQSGAVKFDGYNVKDLDPLWYHRQVALVAQEPVLFSGSIADNIAYGLTAERRDIEEAAKMANAFGFITDHSKFPKGFDTVVGERGVLLSGGQKQRIAIARALIRKPKVLILDEATSALDAESEHQVQQALDKLIEQASQTVIVIAHRLSTIRHADMIIVLRKGEIVEQGTHEELLGKKQHYAELVAHQLQSPL